MPSFTELLTSSGDELICLFDEVYIADEKDFIRRINNIAKQLRLNHTQLICALGFNKHIRDLKNIQQQLGFRSFKLLGYRQNELFTTDTYKQLSIDNILDIYSERLEDGQTLEMLRKLLRPRLAHIERNIEETNEPAYIISYKMEIHTIYTSGIADKAFADDRLQRKIGKFRHLANETNAIIESGYYPPSNLFFMDTVSTLEKQDLIDAGHITKDMIKNRLQNVQISVAERELLEEHF